MSPLPWFACVDEKGSLPVHQTLAENPMPVTTLKPLINAAALACLLACAPPAAWAKDVSSSAGR